MAKLVVLYRQAADPAAFEAHYFERHVPLAKRIAGLLRYETSAGPVASPTGSGPYQLVATLEFGSLDALNAGMASAEGRAAAKDVANFASAGVEMLVFDTRTV